MRMETYRPTKAIIDLGAIRRNTARILQKYPGYRYYMAVVKADAYGHGDSILTGELERLGVDRCAVILKRGYLSNHLVICDPCVFKILP